MYYSMTHLSIAVAMITAVVACSIGNCVGQEQSSCIPAESIDKFCSGRSTMSYIVKVPQASKWLHRLVGTRQTGSGLYANSKNIPDQARVTISCDHDSTDQPATMFLWHETIGTIGLAYSAALGPKGLMFSTVPLLDPGNRRSASGTTPGTFVIVNMCQLQNDYINGLFFNGNQPIPLWFYGQEDGRSRTNWPTDLEVSAANSMSTGAPGDLKHPTASNSRSDVSPNNAAPTDFDRLKFSGIYEFDTEDEVCLANIGLMQRYEQRPPSEKLGKLPPYAEERANIERVKFWERRCPPLKGRLIVVAWNGGPPIHNLDHGTHVSHHVIGSQPIVLPGDGTYRFQSMTPNGDTTGPNNGMFKIDGRFYPQDESLDFFVVRPNLGMTGRLSGRSAGLSPLRILATNSAARSKLYARR
jgi:hypothetical protein